MGTGLVITVKELLKRKDAPKENGTNGYGKLLLDLELRMTNQRHEETEIFKKEMVDRFHKINGQLYEQGLRLSECTNQLETLTEEMKTVRNRCHDLADKIQTIIGQIELSKFTRRDKNS